MKRKQDHYARLARARGYQARSAFKLIEMQQRFRLIRPGGRVLDLGAAPGGWSQVALEELKGGGRVVGVDLQEVSFRGRESAVYVFIRGDMLDGEVRDRIASLGPYDLVLSDAAPSTSGSPLLDTQRSLEIARRALEIGEAVLKEGGSLAVKIFQGGEERELLERLRRGFARARAFRPEASRSESREIYFVGQGFRKTDQTS